MSVSFRTSDLAANIRASDSNGSSRLFHFGWSSQPDNQFMTPTDMREVAQWLNDLADKDEGIKPAKTSAPSRASMTPQCKKLVQHFRSKGNITSVEALTLYRIHALPRRIADLKELGFEIESRRRTDQNNQAYVRYHSTGVREAA